uniref:Putative secreted peptide n=1 Tax=Anopheles braziliensis TaxID=58242 RepID=A0A2M3ZNX6_9DIPT
MLLLLVVSCVSGTSLITTIYIPQTHEKKPQTAGGCGTGVARGFTDNAALLLLWTKRDPSLIVTFCRIRCTDEDERLSCRWPVVMLLEIESNGVH